MVVVRQHEDVVESGRDVGIVGGVGVLEVVVERVCVAVIQRRAELDVDRRSRSDGMEEIDSRESLLLGSRPLDDGAADEEETEEGHQQED